MKKFLILLAVISAASCNDDKPSDDWGTVYSFTSLLSTASDPWEWAYVSLADGAIVGETDNWDIAILRYYHAETGIKTKTGVVVNNVLVTDTERPIGVMVTGGGPPSIGTANIRWSGIEAVDFAFDEMPPVYMTVEPHVFRSWNGERDYKVQFTGYTKLIDDKEVPGYFTMRVEEL